MRCLQALRVCSRSARAPVGRNLSGRIDALYVAALGLVSFSHSGPLASLPLYLTARPPRRRGCDRGSSASVITGRTLMRKIKRAAATFGREMSRWERIAGVFNPHTAGQTLNKPTRGQEQSSVSHRPHVDYPPTTTTTITPPLPLLPVSCSRQTASE